MSSDELENSWQAAKYGWGLAREDGSGYIGSFLFANTCFFIFPYVKRAVEEVRSP